MINWEHIVRVKPSSSSSHSTRTRMKVSRKVTGDMEKEILMEGFTNSLRDSSSSSKLSRSMNSSSSNNSSSKGQVEGRKQLSIITGIKMERNITHIESMILKILLRNGLESRRRTGRNTRSKKQRKGSSIRRDMKINLLILKISLGSESNMTLTHLISTIILIMIG